MCSESLHIFSILCSLSQVARHYSLFPAGSGRTLEGKRKREVAVISSLPLHLRHHLLHGSSLELTLILTLRIINTITTLSPQPSLVMAFLLMLISVWFHYLLFLLSPLISQYNQFLALHSLFFKCPEFF